MNKSIILTAFLCLSTLFSLSVLSQDPEADKEKVGSIAYKMLAAKHEYNENNMRGALLIYREILVAEPDNALAQYRTAECHYKLKKYKLALKYLEKAKTNDPEVEKEMDFFYGKTYHRMERLDDAISSFEKFLSTAGKRTIEYRLAEMYVAQCKYAQLLMKEPVPVEISNIGREINSRFDEYAPSITADGKMLVFTSRRSDTEGGEIDETSDYKFFEDVYYSEWDEKLGEWSDSESLPGDVNTDSYDAVLSINPKGDQMFIYKNNAKLAGDIFISNKSNSTQEWFAPERMPKPINTSYYEGSISITNDGKTVYFISERTGGNGSGDIYTCKKEKDGSWGKAENLGKIINTQDDEKFVFIHPNGKTLYFSSKGHQTMGSYDIFKSELVDGKWGTPVNLGYPINTVNEESTFSLTSDNSKLLVAAEYDDSQGERDIYMIDVSQYELISSGYDKATFLSLQGSIDKSGKLLKKAQIKFYSAGSERFIGETTTDKEGKFKINLRGDQEYKVEIIYKGETTTKTVNAKLDDTGTTVMKLNWSI